MRVFKYGIVPSILVRCNECCSILSVNKNDIDVSDFIPARSWPYIGGYNYSFKCLVCKSKNFVRKEQVDRLDKKQTKVRVRARFR